MKVAFRVDSSTVIGSGHVYRCLSLAIQLIKQDYQVTFICTNHVGNVNRIIQEAGFKLLCLGEPAVELVPEDTSTWLGTTYSEDAANTITALNSLGVLDYLIVDHYGIDSRWESLLTPYSAQIVVIDDLANRAHKCDILLDQTYGRLPSDYSSYVTPGTKLLLGTEYALLREEFLIAIPTARHKRLLNKSIKHVLISLGGTDRTNVSKTLIDLLNQSPLENTTQLTIIAGPNNPHYPALIDASVQSRFVNCRVLRSISNMAEVLTESDLAIGASGASAWERCSLGLPSINIELASNQKDICRILSKKGAALSLGTPDKLNALALTTAIKNIQMNYQTMVENAVSIVDGKGTLRASTALINKPLNDGNIAYLKLAGRNDCHQFYLWQLEPATRANSLNPAVPTWTEHQQWFSKQISNQNNKLYLVVSNGEPLGMLRLDLIAPLSYEISIVTAQEKVRTGVASAALKLARALLPKAKLYATILAKNHASIGLFINQGFERIEQNRYLQKAHGMPNDK
ncbi:UDP-2,4-diacetamido-2,4,6-trideoxy-beta-L-altropy ranose hydrolase [Agarivorans sp. Toyoura001]|uniref:UDP-2,4-diacetamido-2,4, 6-trideoxy-beta-L-altropyranose hydrolase n=1 Tax=Agarivorans sp. Toyoura001 TaxID=2283141 RepID=UPI0010DC7AA3|nr:UDP-2,4-diacetamido-2,4,6-trideoxy-beta-L-altropyranose hydrolase [Agarivorans sp. Toyoura001]GDY27928.1 UDP-2,4-diacetamido-2,4,6-trideoxy-beta-L-altropy ranose hydrolase [Agarivorans sp. Toyoura001]